MQLLQKRENNLKKNKLVLCINLYYVYQSARIPTFLYYFDSVLLDLMEKSRAHKQLTPATQFA